MLRMWSSRNVTLNASPNDTIMEIFDDLNDLKTWSGRSCAVVYGSYRATIGSREYSQGVELGKRLAERDWVSCTGGDAGVMEAVLEGASRQGGQTVGILTKYFDFIELEPNPWVKAAIIADGLMDRMFAFYRLGDVFVVFPGST